MTSRYKGLKIDTLRRMVQNRTSGHCKTGTLNEGELIEELEAFDRAYKAKYGELPPFDYKGTHNE